MSFIAGNNYILVSGTDYTPGAGTVSEFDSHVLSIHILASLTAAVTIEHPNGKTTTLPAAALQVGAIYP